LKTTKPAKANALAIIACFYKFWSSFIVTPVTWDSYPSNLNVRKVIHSVWSSLCDANIYHKQTNN